MGPIFGQKNAAQKNFPLKIFQPQNILRLAFPESARTVVGSICRNGQVLGFGQNECKVKGQGKSRNPDFLSQMLKHENARKHRHLHFRNPSVLWWGQFAELGKFLVFVKMSSCQCDVSVENKFSKKPPHQHLRHAAWCALQVFSENIKTPVTCTIWKKTFQHKKNRQLSSSRKPITPLLVSTVVRANFLAALYISPVQIFWQLSFSKNQGQGQVFRNSPDAGTERKKKLT